MKSDAQLGPGLKLPPPTIYLVALFIGLGLDYLWPTSPLASFWGRIIEAALIVVSIPIMPPVLARFRKVGTPFDVRKPATALITDGQPVFAKPLICVFDAAICGARVRSQ